MRTFLEATRRSLTATEQRALRRQMAIAHARAARLRRRTMVTAAGVTAALWLATLLASDSDWTTITVFWLVVGSGIGFWSVRSDGAGRQRTVGELESALRRNEADVYEVRSRAVAEVDEHEDEGALYAFDLGDGRLVWIAGQDFYADRRFPCLEFTLTYPLTEVGTPAWMFLQHQSAKVSPSFTLPSSFRERPDAPEHLEVWRREWGRESLQS
jgi:hypothetical protein